MQIDDVGEGAAARGDETQHESHGRCPEYSLHRRSPINDLNVMAPIMSHSAPIVDGGNPPVPVPRREPAGTVRGGSVDRAEEPVIGPLKLGSLVTGPVLSRLQRGVLKDPTSHLGAVRQGELLEDVTYVLLHRLVTDVEFRPD